jgi:hypothetical protein
MFGAVAVGIAPMLLLGFSGPASQSEQVLGISAFAFGCCSSQLERSPIS